MRLRIPWLIILLMVTAGGCGFMSHRSSSSSRPLENSPLGSGLTRWYPPPEAIQASAETDQLVAFFQDFNQTGAIVAATDGVFKDRIRVMWKPLADPALESYAIIGSTDPDCLSKPQLYLGVHKQSNFLDLTEEVWNSSDNVAADQFRGKPFHYDSSKPYYFALEYHFIGNHPSPEHPPGLWVQLSKAEPVPGTVR